MKDNDNRLGKNIRSLREAFGETQLDLRLAIGLESSNTISNYEKGIRYPEPEYRRKIAEHYRITEDDLIHSDFSQFKTQIPRMMNNIKLFSKKSIYILFPIVSSADALADPLFKTAYEAHRRIIDKMLNDEINYDEKDDEDFLSYYDSFDKNHTIESIVNLLSMSILSQFCIKNSWVVEGGKALKHNKIMPTEYFKKFYLRDCSSPEVHKYSEGIEIEKVKSVDDLVLYLLRTIKQNLKYSDLAYYYVVLQYLFNCTDNGNTIAMNQAIGSNMLSELAKLGNPYAKRCRKWVQELIFY